MSAIRFAPLLVLLLAGCSLVAPTPDPATAEAVLRSSVEATVAAVTTRQAGSGGAVTVAASPAVSASTSAAPGVPTAAGTPRPQLSAEEAAYVRSVVALIQEFDRSYDRFGGLVEDPHPEDASWRLQMEAELTLWTNGAAAARGGQAPPAFQTMHERIVTGLLLYGQAASQITDALKTGDDGLARQGVESATQARRSFAEAEAEFNRIAQERGL